MDETDEGLIARIQEGNHQAFSVLVHRHSDKFYALAWRLLMNEAEADDVVQEAFIKLWTQPDLFQVDKGYKFTTWFYRVVSNMALDRLRGRKKWVDPSILEYMQDQNQQADELYDEKQRQVHLEQAIRSLPERQRLALTLRLYEDLSVVEAAKVMGIGEKACESLLMRAKAGIRNHMNKFGLLAKAKEVRHEQS